jgi:hypothetical protein
MGIHGRNLGQKSSPGPWAADFSPARGKSIHHFNWLNYHWRFQTVLDIPNIFVPGWVGWVSRIFGQDIMEHVQKIRLLQNLALQNTSNIWGVHTQTPIRSAWKESSNRNGCAFTSYMSRLILSNKNRGYGHHKQINGEFSQPVGQT